jgi:hypothetical protein
LGRNDALSQLGARIMIDILSYGILALCVVALMGLVIYLRTEQGGDEH